MAEHHDGLIYAMVLASAADREMTDSELQSMGDMVRTLPVFDGFNEEDLPDATRACAELLNDDAGLENAIELSAPRCRSGSMRPPRQSAAMLSPPMARPARKSSACSRWSATASTSTASSPPASNAAPARGICRGKGNAATGQTPPTKITTQLSI